MKGFLFFRVDGGGNGGYCIKTKDSTSTGACALKPLRQRVPAEALAIRRPSFARRFRKLKQLRRATFAKKQSSGRQAINRRLACQPKL